MKQLSIEVSNFPDLFIARTNSDIRLAKKNGLPYIIWRTDDYDRLVKILLYHLVQKMMPEIDWAKVWGLTPHDKWYCRDGHFIHANGNTVGEEHEFSIDEFLITNDAKVNIEELEALHLLPKFLADITDCIRQNITDYTWYDGRNKKTGLWTGNYIPQQEAGNLVILDISCSIPVGISSVMLRLIDTIRHKCNAELIVTGGKSYYWGLDEELPTPQKIRDMIPRANESEMFQKILAERIAGRHWGNIISFGDNDAPKWSSWYMLESSNAKSLYGVSYRTEMQLSMQGTQIDHVWHYHTHGFGGSLTGYAAWTREFSPKEDFNTSWCSFMER